MKPSKIKANIKKLSNDLLLTDANEIDGALESYFINYDDEDIMNAVMIFSCILWNRLNKSDKASIKNAEEFWDAIHKFVEKYTDINTKEFYK